MKMAKRKTENVMGSDLGVGDVIVDSGGFEWQVDSILFEPSRHVCTCHWTGNGARPLADIDHFELAQTACFAWMRVVNPRPRRLVCRTEAPAWYATQVGRHVELRRTGTDEVLARIGPPPSWGDAWGWNLIDGGVLVERTGR